MKRTANLILLTAFLGIAAASFRYVDYFVVHAQVTVHCRSGSTYTFTQAKEWTDYWGQVHVQDATHEALFARNTTLSIVSKW